MIVPEFLTLIEKFFKLVFNLSLIYLTFVFINIGITYITSSSGEKIKEINKKFPLILIGIALLFFSFVIPKLIGAFFNISIDLFK